MFYNNTELVGSIGFAQVGRPDYYARWRMEKSIMRDILKRNPLFEVPLKLQSYVYFTFSAHPHDFGTYHDLEIKFSSYIEKDEELNELFWNWFNDMESFDWESLEIMERCRTAWHEKNQMKVIHDQRDNPLKKVDDD